MHELFLNTAVFTFEVKENFLILMKSAKVDV